MAKKFTGKRGKVKSRKTYKFRNTIKVAPRYKLVNPDIDMQIDYFADEMIQNPTISTGIWEKYTLESGKTIETELKVGAATLYVAQKVAAERNKPLSDILKAWSDLGSVFIPVDMHDEHWSDINAMADVLREKYIDQLALDGLVDVVRYAEETFENPNEAVMFMYGLSDVEPTELEFDVAEQDWERHSTTLEGRELCSIIRKIVDEDIDSTQAELIFNEPWNIKSLREKIGAGNDRIMKILAEAEELIREQRR